MTMRRTRRSIRRVALALVAMVGVGAAGAQARVASSQDPAAVMIVGSARAERGHTAMGHLQVPAAADAATTIDVAVVHGAKPGKVVAFVSGSHGTEYASIVALTHLISKVDPQALSGTVIVLPLLNVASFEQMTVHVNPIDKKGMNAGYPGNATGTQTERALAMVADQVVRRPTSSSISMAAISTKTCGHSATGRAPATRCRTTGRRRW